jgi:hypothetical protein
MRRWRCCTVHRRNVGVRAKTCAQVLGTMVNESARYFTGARKILRNQCTRETVKWPFVFEMDCNHDVTCRISTCIARHRPQVHTFRCGCVHYVRDFDKGLKTKQTTPKMCTKRLGTFFESLFTLSTGFCLHSLEKYF